MSNIVMQCQAAQLPVNKKNECGRLNIHTCKFIGYHVTSSSSALSSDHVIAYFIISSTFV